MIADYRKPLTPGLAQGKPRCVGETVGGYRCSLVVAPGEERCRFHGGRTVREREGLIGRFMRRRREGRKRYRCPECGRRFAGAGWARRCEWNHIGIPLGRYLGEGNKG